MLNFYLSYAWLYFTRPSKAAPVPDGLERHWVATRGGNIEVLTAPIPPDTPAVPGPPIVFCHGGMGGAWVWAEYMRYLSARGVRCYAVSVRGHGGSWYPFYVRMVCATPRSALEDDLVAAVDWVREKEGAEDVVLVGHSSGGGLSQSVLAQGRVRARALGLLGAVPAFGSLGVYINWWRLDPWFTLRCALQFWHPNSPLSCPELTHRAFFGSAFPASAVIPFQERMSRYESYMWPFSMMRPFATADKILAHVGENNSSGRPRVLVMAGSQDKLMTPDVTRQTAAFYRAASDDKGDDKGVRMCLVEGAGHHLQNDVQWEDGAARLLAFYNEVV